MLLKAMKESGSLFLVVSFLEFGLDGCFGESDL
jgi:hypothetical protein